MVGLMKMKNTGRSHGLGFWLLWFWVFIHMSVLPTYVSMSHVPWKAKEAIKSPGTEVMDGCEPPCGCYELNTGLLPQVPLSTETPFKPWVSSLKIFLKFFYYVSLGMYVWICALDCSVHRGQMRALNLLELQLQVIVRDLTMWLLNETQDLCKNHSSHWVIPLAP